jgi:hypothetical protein
MADAGNNPTNPGGSGSGDGSGAPRRKLAGKYDSVEEAIDKGLFGLEQGFHETREQLGAIKTLLERGMTPIGRGREDHGYNDDDQGYNRGRRPREEDGYDFDEAEFLTSPKRILRERDKRMIDRAKAEIINTNKRMISDSAAVLRFQMKNPDLDEHEHIVEGFYKRTDPNKNVYERLVDAGKETRKYLAKFKGDNDEGRGAGRTPDNDEYVEGAGRGADRTGQRGEGEGAAGAGGVFNPDDQLAQEIADQKAWKARRFVPPERK